MSYDHNCISTTMNLITGNQTPTPHNQLLLQATLGSLATFLFVLGILLGVLFTKCAQRVQARNKSTAPVVHDHALMPIYEEVPVKTAVDNIGTNCKVEENVAYGPGLNDPIRMMV